MFGYNRKVMSDSNLRLMRACRGDTARLPNRCGTGTVTPAHGIQIQILL